MKKILIVEDEQHLADGLKYNLEAEGYDASIAVDGRAAVDALRAANFDAVVLDVMLPVLSGFDVARQMRDGGDYTPVLMLTALGNPEDVLKGFESGADDYLPKPFDLDIFLARLNGLLRRKQWMEQSAGTKPDGEAIEINGRTIDLENLELKYQGEIIPLTLMEVNLLRYLIENEGHPVSRKSILEDVWGLQVDTDTRAIDNFIVRLRKHLEDDPSDPRIVQTVRGVGYRYNGP
ncbi:MAG: response regulator transcription factor [Acidobacteria bacterium]|nr:response regulator transcription factor [Acidobacteriota bacterium]